MCVCVCVYACVCVFCAYSCRISITTSSSNAARASGSRCSTCSRRTATALCPTSSRCPDAICCSLRSCRSRCYSRGGSRTASLSRSSHVAWQTAACPSRRRHSRTRPADSNGAARARPAGLHRVESRSVQVQAVVAEERERDCVNGSRVEQETASEDMLRLRRSAASPAGANTADSNYIA